MQISLQWLNTYIDTGDSAQKLADLITSSGLEVEAIERFETVKGGLQGLVIGEVLEKWKHPDADKLSVTKVKVDEAGTAYQIVCGAPNVDAGQKVVVALPGTTLYPTTGEPFKIKKSKIRGEESNGMICAEDEIGLGSGHDGIMILDADTKVGMPASEYFDVRSDEVLHIGLTPNRIDAASHIGVAREVAALYAARQKKDVKVCFPSVPTIPVDGTCPVQIEIQDVDLCRRYAGVVLENVQVGESPAWLKQRLESIGVRPINNVVDITNFVMMECGQPLHAFDADQIEGQKIVVRLSDEGSTFTTLDEVERKLTGKELMICDAKKPMCIAGVFGGMHSGISDSTKRVFIESAWFDPVSVRKTGRHHGLHTDASFRFERGADPEMTLWALQRAAELMMEICDAQIKGGITDTQPASFTPTEIEFSPKALDQFAGVEIDDTVLSTILEKLDMTVLSKSEKWKVRIPLYRVDVTRVADLYEEVLRIYGYDQIPFAEKLSASLSFRPDPDPEKWMQSVSDHLTAEGFNEILNNSLSAGSWAPLLGEKTEEQAHVLNPLSQELDTMRISMLPGGLHAIAYNLHRQQHDQRFYELGKVYRKKGDAYEEEEKLALWICGKDHAEHWKEKPAAVNWYDMLARLESVLNKFIGMNSIKRQTASQSGLLNAVEYVQGKDILATAGEVHGALLDKADVDAQVFYAEINWPVFLKKASQQKIQFSEIARFPSVRRDISLLLDESITFSTLQSIIKKADPQLIREILLFDQFKGEKLGAGKKSYAIAIQMQRADRTLTDQEIDQVMQKVVSTIKSETGAELR